ncbi:TPA: bifunctional hydroxymethylpyrimidine kinase/phosphomethylpyrimidine kinase [Streptococcus pneumoniae]|nr:bifunctional hydroxymethylpyrimidine kinase/phosphomethylpyrimidine kinase [Streptococcus pneumoniae]HEU6396574.1 bifunctional hydroxymethylpyrimidine kinase/phosphomethylpyrimidine kinase [Streptococcus pneumoniae]
MKNNRILALSGNDIFSGGGLSADLATYTLNGLHGFVAVTCLTALTEKGFEVFPTDDTIFQHELDSLRDVLRAFFYTNRRKTNRRKGVKMIFK